MRTFSSVRPARARSLVVGVVAAGLTLAAGTTTAGAVVVPAQTSGEQSDVVVDVRSEDFRFTDDEAGGCHIGEDLWEHCVYYQEGLESFSRVVPDRRPAAGKDGALRMATPEPDGEILLRYSAHDDGREYPAFGDLARISVALDVRARTAPTVSLRVDCTPESAMEDGDYQFTYAGPTPAPGSGWTTVDLYDDGRALWRGTTSVPRPISEYQALCPDGAITGPDLHLDTEGADVGIDRLAIGHRVVNFWIPWVSRVDWGWTSRRVGLDQEDRNRQHTLAQRQFVAYSPVDGGWVDPGRPRLPQANGAVVVPQGVPVNALIGGPLANALDGPLLVNPAEELRWPISSTLWSTVPRGSTIYLVGNTRQLRPKVAAQLREHYRTVRIAGPTPYATAAAVARRIDRLDPKKRRTVVLASTTRFAHSLSASAAAGSARGTVLLTRGDTLPPATRRYVGSRPVSRLAVGPEAAAAVPALPSARRLVGAHPPATAVRVAERFFPRPRAATFAPADRPVAALLAGAYGGEQRQPLLLVRDRRVPPVVLRYLRPRRDRMKDSLVMAGERTVSDATVARLHQVLRAR